MNDHGVTRRSRFRAACRIVLQRLLVAIMTVGLYVVAALFLVWLWLSARDWLMSQPRVTRWFIVSVVSFAVYGCAATASSLLLPGRIMSTLTVSLFGAIVGFWGPVSSINSEQRMIAELSSPIEAFPHLWMAKCTCIGSIGGQNLHELIKCLGWVTRIRSARKRSVS